MKDVVFRVGNMFFINTTKVPDNILGSSDSNFENKELTMHLKPILQQIACGQASLMVTMIRRHYLYLDSSNNNYFKT